MKKVLILGATSAMAEHAARCWAADRCSFFLVGRNATKLKSIAEDLNVRGAESVEVHLADLAVNAGHAEVLTAAAAAFNKVPDIALIAHGVLGDQEAEQSNPEQAEANLRVNFLSPAHLAGRVAEQMAEAGQGTVAVISSVAGDRGRQSNYVYGSAKAGLNAYLSGLRNRMVKQNVRVVTIKPGFVDTPMTAHIKKGPLFASAEKAGRLIYKHTNRGTAIAYVPWFWRFIMLIIRHIPETVFKRLSL